MIIILSLEIKKLFTAFHVQSCVMRRGCRRLWRWKSRLGPRNGSEFLGELGLCRATHSVTAWPRRGADVSCGAPTRGGQLCGGQDVRLLMIKTCFYTINYVLCKQRVAEYWIWRVGMVSTITGTITHKQQRTRPTSTEEYPHFCRRTYFLLFLLYILYNCMKIPLKSVITAS